jgi:hypothetical protein
MKKKKPIRPREERMSGASMLKDKYYVTMTDKFMSGWGKAEGMPNKVIFVCDTIEEANHVYYKAIQRTEMKYVYIATTRPEWMLLSKYREGVEGYEYHKRYSRQKIYVSVYNWANGEWWYR